MPQSPQEKAIMIQLRQNDKALDKKVAENSQATREFVDAIKSGDKIKIKEAQKLVTEKTKGLSELTEEKLELKDRLSIKQDKQIVKFWNNSDVAQRKSFLIHNTNFDDRAVQGASELAFQSLNENFQNKISQAFEERVVRQIKEFRRK